MRSRVSVLSVFALFAVLVTSTHAFAQGTTVGVQGGINVANVSFTPEDSNDPFNPDFKSRTRAVFGGFVARDFNSKAGLQIDFLYTQKGSKFDFTEDDGTDIAFEAGIDYIEIPVLIRANIPGSGSVKARVFAGPSFAFKVTDDINATADGFTIPDEEVAEFKSTDFGLVIGGAVQFGQVFVDVRYNWGLVNILDDAFGDDLKTRTFGIMVGFQFK